MKFRLTYEGELRPSQRDPIDQQAEPLAVHKHQIRTCFHNQLKHLWETNRFLAEMKVWPKDYGIDRAAADNAFSIAADKNQQAPLVEVVAELYREYGYRFVPLVQERWHLLCSLDILVLRRDYPGTGVVHAGDIDNRIKTLIDALRRPRNQTELVDGDRAPGPGEDPFFVLMEDDSQVSHLSVEAGLLLDPPTSGSANARHTKVLVTVELRPYYVTLFNMSLSGS